MKLVKFYLLFGLLLLVFLSAIFFIFNTGNPFNKPSFFINKDQAAIVKQMRQISRLETASFTIEKIIEAGTSGNAFQQLLYGDRILLIAHGEVIAGFNLEHISQDDITITGDTITMKLPPPQILLTRIDNEKTRVYDRNQGLLSRGDKDLETEARIAAEQTIQEAACEADILQEASDNARKQLITLLRAFGFTTVTLEIPEGSC